MQRSKACIISSEFFFMLLDLIFRRNPAHLKIILHFFNNEDDVDKESYLYAYFHLIKRPKIKIKENY